VGCPDDATLLSMIEHSVDPGRFGELEVHIDGCEHCRKVVAALALGSRSPSGPHQPFAGLDQTLAIGATISDRYIVKSEIGRGGMGTVYVASDKTLDRDVALKLHRAGSGGDRLQREAIAMAKLAHPNVVNVFEVASVDDRMYVAMEYVRGTTLRGWLSAKPRTWREIVAMLVEAGRGLAAAHAGGLVHRDFKPENVLVGEDGRPRVGDFGLARAEHTATVADAAITAGTSLTVTGAVAGTPAYMAPEQLAGESVDARCDQFAFCVVAWELLYGRRPFAGATLGTIQLAIERHELDKPSKTDVPDRVRRVIEHGLEVDPAARYADMAALLAALQRAAAPRTTRNLAASAVSAIAIGIGAYAIYSGVTARYREAACDSAHDRVRQLLDEPTRAAIERDFLASGSVFARSAFEHATAVLDRYTGALADQAGAVCRDRDEPERVIASRTACLSDRQTELAGLIDAFAHADAELVARAPDAAWAVFDPIPCTEATPATTSVFAPAQASKLGEIKTLARTGGYRKGVGLATALLADARAAKDKSFELAVLTTLGQLQIELDPPAAVATFHDAEALAEAQGRDLEAALALDQLASSTGTDQHDYVAAHREVELARAKLARIGGNAALEGRLAMTEAQILMDENRLGDAEASMRRAVITLERIYGSGHPTVGAAYGTLSEILRAEMRTPEALATARHALEVLSAALGPDHPTVAGSEMNLASALINSNQIAEARERLLRADAVFVKVYGADHPTRAAVQGNLGGLELAEQHWDAALAAFRTALGIVERTEGPNSPSVAQVELDIVNALGGAGRLDEALVENLKAVAVLDKLGPDGEVRLAEALDEVGEVQLARGRAAQAIPYAERALALVERRPADANPVDLADARFMLARLLAEAKRDLVRARGLAEQAANHPDPDKRATIATWLHDHAR
jgi:tetratricopeptide (TPR) repeat protein/predicted Ser/Thr protein kinase